MNLEPQLKNRIEPKLEAVEGGFSTLFVLERGDEVVRIWDETRFAVGVNTLALVLRANPMEALSGIF